LTIDSILQEVVLFDMQTDSVYVAE